MDQQLQHNIILQCYVVERNSYIIIMLQHYTLNAQYCIIVYQLDCIHCTVDLHPMLNGIIIETV